jgi:hypothetical protein
MPELLDEEREDRWRRFENFAPRRRYTEPLEGLMGNRLHYTVYPSTVTLMYSVYGVFALTSMVAAEMAIRDNALRPSSEIFSVGPVPGIVVVGATSVRAACFSRRMFFEKGKAGDPDPLAVLIRLP